MWTKGVMIILLIVFAGIGVALGGEATSNFPAIIVGLCVLIVGVIALAVWTERNDKRKED